MALVLQPSTVLAQREVQSLTHDMDFGSGNSLVHVAGDTYALAYGDAEGDGILKTFSISDDGTVITELQAIEHEPLRAGLNSLVHVAGDTYALAYDASSLDGVIKTFEISADGSTITEIQTLTHEVGELFRGSLVQLDADTYVLAYQASMGRGMIKTFDISADGTTITEVRALMHGQQGAITRNELLKIGADTFALAYSVSGMSGGGAGIKTFTISADGSSITEIAQLTHGPSLAFDSSLVEMAAGIYALAYGGDGGEGLLKTFAISSDGTSIAELHSIVHDTRAFANELVKVGADTYALAYDSEPGAALVKSFKIPADGGSISELRALEHENNVNLQSFVRVDSDTFALAYLGSAGILKTFEIAFADLQITKDDGLDFAAPGSPLTYTIVASNLGPDSDPAVTVTDTFPPELSCTYTSVAVGGATGNTNPGAGDLADVLSMPVGSTVTYSATCIVDPSTAGTVSNTATISGSLTELAPSDNSATDITGVSPLDIPVSDGIGLLLLSLLIAGAALRRLPSA